MRVFYKEEIPDYLHYRNDENIGKNKFLIFFGTFLIIIFYVPNKIKLQQLLSQMKAIQLIDIKNQISKVLAAMTIVLNQ